MAKFIDRNTLPQYRYYNQALHTPHSMGGWNVSRNRITGWQEGKQVFSSELNAYWYITQLVELTRFLSEYGPDSKEAGVLYFQIKRTLLEDKQVVNLTNHLFMLARSYIFTMQAITNLWCERLEDAKNHIHNRFDLIKSLTTFHNFTELAMFIPCAQGTAPVPGINKFSKFLMLSGDVYNRNRLNGTPPSDITNLLRLVSGTPLTVVIDSKEKKPKNAYVICTNEEENRGVISINVINPRNGVSRFLVQQKEGKAPDIGGDVRFCHPKGEYFCNSENMECIYCDGSHDCHHDFLPDIAALVYCLSLYADRVYSEREDNKSLKDAGNGTKSGKMLTAPKLLPANAIRTYDIDLRDSEKEEIIKQYGDVFAKRHITLTEKSPHIRRSTMRFNPRTGKRDIKVRSCVIHADRYEGFTSTVRVTESNIGTISDIASNNE